LVVVDVGVVLQQRLLRHYLYFCTSF
jgi:hypothetical protein